jgi:serine/threonine-protein kinase
MQALGNLADTYERIPGRSQAARDTFARGLARAEAELQRQPTHTGVLSRAALFQAKLGRRAAAADLIRRAREANPQSGSAFWFLARAAEVEGDRTSAIEFARQAMQKGYTAEDLKIEPDLSRLSSDPRWQGSGSKQ